tara:strand:+ start:2199 stop:2816 length:618 start_codon:yes stop_codon:yes gene_type:complete
MQTFETFMNVCAFFIQSRLDKNYVERIDKLLEKPSNRETILLVKHVKSFHAMRKQLCVKILNYTDNHDIFNQLVRGRGCVQYKTAPTLSTCTISGVALSANTGLLLIVDSKKLITIHLKYKILLYHFWSIVHMPEEIGLEANKWLQTQTWWKLAIENDIEKCTQKVLNYNDQHFVKAMYIKLKTIAEYVENDMRLLPKNVSHKRR